MTRSFGVGALLIVAVAALLAFVHPAFRALPVTPPDTISYISWDPLRPLAYPAVLSAASALDPSLRMLGIVQLALFLASATALAWRVSRLLASPGAGWLLLSGIVLNPQVVSYAFSAIPESLFTASLMLHVSAVIGLVTTCTRRSALLAGASAAFAILLKPVAVAWLGALPLLWWSLRRLTQARQLIIVWGISLAAPVLAASAVNDWRIGVFAPQAAVGFQLVGLSAPFVDEQTPLEPELLRIRLVEELQPIRRELASLDALEWYYFYSSISYHETIPRVERVIKEVFPETAGATRDAFVALNDVAASITRAAIPHAPWKYARHIAAHLYGLWLMPLVRSASEQPPFEGKLSAMRERLPILGANPVMYRAIPAPGYWLLRALLVTAFVGATAGVLLLVVSPRVPMAVVAIAYAGALLHAHFLATAAGQTGLPRYALAAWPLTVLVVVGWLAWLTGAMSKRRSQP
jgi:hypothetical protein